MAGCVILGFTLVRREQTVGQHLSYIVLTTALIMLVVFCPFLRTSGRKSFYLKARALKPGISLKLVNETMSDYEVFDKCKNSITLSYRSSPSTVDEARSATRDNLGLQAVFEDLGHPDPFGSSVPVANRSTRT